MTRNSENRKWLAAAFASAAVAQFSAQAGLSKLDIGYYSDYSTTVVAQGSTHGTYATAFQASLAGGAALPASHSNPFVTFCLDINTTLASGWWQSGSFSDVPVTVDLNDPSQPTGPATRNVNPGLHLAANLYAQYAGNVAAAFNLASSPARTAARQEGAALQLAIWEVLYETGSTLKVDSGVGTGFYVSSGNSTVIARANAMLNSLGSNPNISIDTTFWNAVDANGHFRSSQDLIGPQAPVPEPGTLIAGGLLLLPFLASTLRRKASA